MSGLFDIIRDLLDNPDPQYERRQTERRVIIRPTPDRRAKEVPPRGERCPDLEVQGPALPRVRLFSPTTTSEDRMKRLIVFLTTITMALGLTAGAASANVDGPFTTQYGCRFYTDAYYTQPGQFLDGIHLVGKVTPSPFANCYSGQVKMHYKSPNGVWHDGSIPYTPFNGQGIASYSAYPVDFTIVWPSGMWVDTNAADSHGFALGNRHTCPFFYFPYCS